MDCSILVDLYRRRRRGRLVEVCMVWVGLAEMGWGVLDVGVSVLSKVRAISMVPGGGGRRCSGAAGLVLDSPVAVALRCFLVIGMVGFEGVCALVLI